MKIIGISMISAADAYIALHASKPSVEFVPMGRFLEKSPMMITAMW
jgi:hypothetical protein